MECLVVDTVATTAPDQGSITQRLDLGAEELDDGLVCGVGGGGGPTGDRGVRSNV